MWFVDLEKAFDTVPRKVMEWALKKKFTSSVGESSNEVVRGLKDEGQSWIGFIGGIWGKG